MKEKDNDEEQEEEIINTNSKNIIIENPQSPKENSPLESLTEINSEFSENIYFTHFYLAQRELDFEPKPNGDVIPYMMSRDFLYSLFEDKKNYKNANNETYQQILGRVKQFMNSNDDNFNKIFLDHFTYYWDVLGKKNAENIIIPVLSKITEDKIGTRIYFLKKLKNFLEFFEQLGEEGIDIIKNNILNIIEQLYRNKLNPDKKNLLPKKFVITEEEKKEHDDLLFERLLQCCKILIKSKYKEELFKNILELIRNEENNDNNNIIIFKKILSIKLMTNLSADFGEEFTKKNIVPILDEFLTKNEDIKIKEETAMSLIILVQKLKIDFIGEYVINSLEKISNDKFWIIRKKCIEILYKIIPELNMEKDQEENKIIKDYETKIIALIEKFIEDKNEKVRFYLIEKIGEIIK